MMRTAPGLDSDAFPRPCITRPGRWSLLIPAHPPVQPPRTCAFQAAVSAFLQNGLLICTLAALPSTPRRASASPLGPKALRTTGYETQKLHTQIPWKVDRACPACASHPSVPNTPHLICMYVEKQKSMLARRLDCEPLTSNHLKATDSNLEH